jgi:hypothetical protein
VRHRHGDRQAGRGKTARPQHKPIAVNGKLPKSDARGDSRDKN